MEVPCLGGRGTPLKPPPCPESAPYLEKSPPSGAAPSDYGLGSPRPTIAPPMTPQAGVSEAAWQAFRFSSIESLLTFCSGFFPESFHGYLSRQGQSVQTFLPTSDTLSSLRSVTPTQRVLVCRKRPSSAYIRVAVERRIRLFPSTTCSSVTRGPRDRRHVWFSPTAHTGHSSAHEQGRRRFYFVVDDVTPLRTFRHPNTGMSSRPQHSAPSIAFLSRMGASIRGIFLFGPATHFSLAVIPPASTGFIRQ